MAAWCSSGGRNEGTLVDKLVTAGSLLNVKVVYRVLISELCGLAVPANGLLPVFFDSIPRFRT